MTSKGKLPNASCNLNRLPTRQGHAPFLLKGVDKLHLVSWASHNYLLSAARANRPPQLLQAFLVMFELNYVRGLPYLVAQSIAD